MTSYRRDSIAAGVLLLVIYASSEVFASGRLVTFAASDGVALTGLLYEPAQRTTPAVVLVHMLGRSKEDWATTAERLQQEGIASLALDLRGHGQSAGSAADLRAMVGDVRAALAWLASRPGARPTALGVVGASLGANLAAVAATETPLVRAVALISPSLDYRGVRLDATRLRKLGVPIWLAASSLDPYALRTLKELAGGQPGIEQRLSTARAHGTPLLAADHELALALVDWLRIRLIF